MDDALNVKHLKCIIIKSTVTSKLHGNWAFADELMT